MLGSTGPTVADYVTGRFFSSARRAVLPFADPRVKRLEPGGAQQQFGIRWCPYPENMRSLLKS